jgi:uncharacterized membrane protein
VTPRPASASAGKHEAQLRADRIRAFREELAQLEREGAIALEPARRAALEDHLRRTLEDLAARYDVDTSASQKQVSWGMRIASALGGAALCASVVLFFHRFWGALGVPVQVAVLAATPLLLVAATDLAARRERTRYYASLLSAVAFGAFVGNVTVLGSTFNLAPGPTALLAWGAFGLALAYAYRLRLPLAAGLACLCGYLAAGFSTWWGEGHWLSFPERPENFLLAGLALIAVPSSPRHRRFAEFDGTYWALGIGVLFLALLMLSEWGASSYLPFPVAAVETGYQVVAFLAAGIAIWAGVRRGRPGVAYGGAAYFALLLNLRFYHWWWHWMPGYLFFLLIGLIAVALLAFFRRLRGRMAGTPS